MCVCVCVCVSKRICNNVTGPCLVEHETEVGKIFPGNGKFLAIFIYIMILCVCHLENIRVPLVALVPRIGHP